MSKFLNNLGDKFNKFSKKSGEVVEATKLKVEISKIKSDIKEMKSDLGEIVYSLYDGQLEDEGQVGNLCSQIKQSEEKIKDIEKEIGELMPTATKCPQCENKVPAGSKFCNNCGYQVREIEPQIEEVEEEPKVQLCPNCGDEFTEGEKFCGNCGTKNPSSIN